MITESYKQYLLTLTGEEFRKAMIDSGFSNLSDDEEQNKKELREMKVEVGRVSGSLVNHGKVPIDYSDADDYEDGN